INGHAPGGGVREVEGVDAAGGLIEDDAVQRSIGVEDVGVVARSADEFLDAREVVAVEIAHGGAGDVPGVGDVGAVQRVGARAAVDRDGLHVGRVHGVGR